MLFRVLASLFIVSMGLPLLAGGGSSEEGGQAVIKNIKSVVGHYQSSSAIHMLVDKEVYIDYSELTKKSSGTLVFSKGKLRLEIKKPDNFLMLMSDQIIWVENRLSKDMGGTQVTKIKASKKLKERNALLAFLFDDVEVWDSFKVINSKQKNSLTAVSLKPKKGQDIGDIVKINLLVDSRNKKIVKIVYWDGLDNKTTYGFSDIHFNGKISKNLFKYSPPKGANVTTL